ncbi:flippase [Candidatus Woesearchaeota archaeon]|nr:flippase [Candidatus Woesearchaeota archaeon]MCF7900808.1 flippase [Candidatus Woesearchaeota archaeon]MCF8013110.1 flippase [Candidatus Woesearchaeota archaeon]
MIKIKKIFNDWMTKLGIPTSGFGFDFIKNTGWIFGAKILESIISYIIIVLISNNLGAEGLGQYSFLFSFVGLFFIFADMGLSELMVKNLSKNFNKAKFYVSNIFSLKIIFSIASFIVYFIALFFINKDALFVAFIFVGIVQITTNLQYVFLSILRIKQKGKAIAITNIVERVLVVIAAIIILPTTKDLTLFIGFLMVAQLIKSVIIYLYSKSFFKLKLSFNLSSFKDFIKQGFPFLLIGIFSAVYVQLDTIMLSFMKGDVIVGFYQAGYKLINMLNLIPGMLLLFGFPMFSRLIHKNKSSARKLLEKMLQGLLILIIPVVVAVFLIGNRLLEFIYNFNSIESFISFKILIIAEIFIILSMILGSFISSNKPKVFAKLAAFGAGLNILLNFLLIPKYSLYGAGIATLITYLMLFLLMYFYIEKKMLSFNFWKYCVVPIISSLVMFFVLMFNLNLNLIFIVILGVILYSVSLGVSYFAFNLFRREKKIKKVQ